MRGQPSKMIHIVAADVTGIPSPHPMGEGQGEGFVHWQALHYLRQLHSE